MVRYLVISIALILTGGGIISSMGQDQKPNILVYIVDDWGWQDTSVPFWSHRTKWNDFYRTPTLEKLTATGMKFTQAYACSVCSPSRTSIMTGQNAARHHVTNWTLRKDGETSHKTKQLHAPADWERNGLQPDSPNIAQHLQSSGYFTIHAGKAHWGAFDTPGSNPENLGFDVNIAGHAAGGPGHFHGQKNYGNKEKGGYTKPWGIPGLEEYHGTDTHLTDATTREAQKAIARSLELEKPFYLYMAHYAVHAPIMEDHRFIDNYTGKNYPGTTIPITDREADYASMVEGIDHSLGQLLATIESAGESENTLVFVLSDNGGLTRHARGRSPYMSGADTHCWPLREGKGSAYEGGTRIPFIVSWAGHDTTTGNSHQSSLPIPAGSTCNTPIIIEDVPMTLLDIVTGKPSRNLLPGADGRSIVSLLKNPDSKKPGYGRKLVFHYPHQWTGSPSGGYQSHSSMRKGDWKVIYFYESEEWELYHLKDDIYESRDLSDSHPSKLKALANQLKTSLEERGAQFPMDLKSKSPRLIELPR